MEYATVIETYGEIAK